MPVPHHIFQHHQHRSGRQIPHSLQTIPRGVELSIVQIKGVGRRLQDLWPTGMEYPTSDISSVEPVIGQKCVNIFAETLSNQGWDFRGQNNVEALLADLPTHHL